MTVFQRNSLLGGLVLLVAAFIYLNIEQFEYEVNLPFSAEAYRNPSLAMQTHLAQYDIQVQRFDDTKALFSQQGNQDRTQQGTQQSTSQAGQAQSDSEQAIIPNVDTLIIINEAEISIPQSQADQILNWVSGGGHIVAGGIKTEGMGSSFSANSFLKTLGISGQVAAVGEEEDLSFLELYSPTTIESQYYGDIDVDLDRSTYIQVYGAYAPTYIAGSVAGPNFVQIEYGTGLITLMTDVEIWNNWQLQNDDNALLLHDLTMDASQVFVFSYVKPQMWYELIAEYSPTFYYVLLCAILLSLWHVSVRFGAIKTERSQFFTSFFEHIRAAGSYYWHSEQQIKLLEAVREQLFDELLRKHGTHSLVEDKQVANLVKLSGWPEDSIRYLVLSKDIPNQAQFVSMMQQLQLLRKMI